MSNSISELQTILNEKYAALRPLYDNQGANAILISSLNQEIQTLSAKLHAVESDKQEKYVDGAGVFLTGAEQLERNRALATYKSLGLLPQNFTGDLAQYRRWLRREQQKPITDKQWYNNLQSSMLNGRQTPVGGKELKQFLTRSKRNAPLSFAYLKIPDKYDSSLNHFVSMHLSTDRKELTYVDSNGHLMSEEDKKKIMDCFSDPKPNIVYRDKDGKRLSERDANNDPSRLLRVQFDNYNCGVYSTEITALFRDAKGNENLIQQQLKELKNLDTVVARKQHQKCLSQGRQYSREFPIQAQNKARRI